MQALLALPIRFIHFLIRVQETKPYSVYVVLAFCLFTAMGRGLEELLFFQIRLKSSEVVVFLHFYVSLAVILTAGISWIGRLPWQKVANVVLVGIFLGIFPPLIDLLLDHDYPVFYGFFFIHDLREIPWLGFKPEFNFPHGECITIWLSIFFSGYYVFYKTRSLWRSLATSLFAYCGFMLFGSFLPMLVTFVVAGYVPDLAAARALDENLLRAIVYYNAFAQVALASLFYLLLRWPLLLHLIKRSLHPLPFVLLTLLGAVANQTPWGYALLAAGIVFWGGWMNLLQNHVYDAQEERTAHHENAGHEDVLFFNTAFLLATLAVFFTGNRLVIPVLLMYPLTFLYNHPLYRGKKKFPTNLKIEGVWGLGAFLAGVLAAPQTIAARIGLLALLVFGGFSLVAALKDAKDVRTDRRVKTDTLYLRLMRHGLRFRRAHFLLLTLCLLCFGVPIVLLSWQGLFSYALILGTLTLIAAAILYTRYPNKTWFAIFLAFTSVYLLVIVVALAQNPHIVG